MTKKSKLARSFDHEAQLYHEIRPQYPKELFDELIKITHLAADAKLLEIGPGTGQATKTLAARNYAITAIEIGAALAEIARHELRKYPNVNIITGAFEEVELPLHSFDLVFAATAFHWINPALQFRKPHQLLKSDGHLAIIHTHHISDGQGDVFFHMSQPIYQRYFPKSNNVKPKLPEQHEIKLGKLDNKLFQQIHFQLFPLTIRYSAKEYRQLINTYSPTLRLPPEKRFTFLNDIQNLIEEKFEGYLEKYFSISLLIGKKYCLDK